MMADCFRLDGRFGEAAGIQPSVLPCGPTLAMLEFRAFLWAEEKSLCGEIIQDRRVLFVGSLRPAFSCGAQRSEERRYLRIACWVKARIVPRRSMGFGLPSDQACSVQTIDHGCGCAAT